jgi:hypothetical protein
LQSRISSESPVLVINAEKMVVALVRKMIKMLERVSLYQSLGKRGVAK